MAITLDGNTLVVEKMKEKDNIIFTDKDVWVNSVFARLFTVIGGIRYWTLIVRETGIIWNDSDAKSFQTTAEAGTSVTFTSTEPPHDISLSVKILDVEVDYNMVDFGKRVYKLTLVEDMS